MLSFQIAGNERRSLLWWVGHVLIAVLTTAAWVVFSSSEAGSKYEFMIHDALVLQRGARPQPDDVLVVSLDEATYDAWELPMDRPIPRHYYGKLVRRLKELGAKRVVFDVVFVGHSQSEEWDNELANSLEALPTFLAVDHGVVEVNGLPLHEVIKPEPFMTERAAGLALVTMKLDSGVARHFFTDRSAQVAELPTLSEAGAGMPSPAMSRPRSFPAPHDLINYYGPAGSIRTLSMYQVLEEVQPPRELFVNKTVFVGLALRTGLGADQKDRFLTPMGDIFGVEIHATQAANLMNHDWIRRATPVTERWIGGVLVFLNCLLVLILRPVSAAILTVVLAGAWIAAAYFALTMDYFLTGGSAVLAAVPIVFLVNTTYNYLVTLRSQREIEEAFSHYLSPEIIRELKRNPQLMKLGGDEVMATAVFTDIKGFTTMSEKLGAKRVTQMLNAYFTDVSQAVFDEGGTVIKFIGDAVFAIWGAPVPFEDHATRACRAALKIQQTVDAFNARQDFPPLVTRVGVNTGVMMVGNLGSAKRMDYTAIGDSVNLAARVEGVNKYMGTTVLVTEDCLEHAGTGFCLLSMGAIRVVGKNKPVRLFRVTAEEVDPDMKREWEAALALWAAQSWTDAKDRLTHVREHYPELAIAAQTYIDAVAGFEAAPPGPEWQGELDMDHK